MRRLRAGMAALTAIVLIPAGAHADSGSAGAGGGEIWAGVQLGVPGGGGGPGSCSWSAVQPRDAGRPEEAPVERITDGRRYRLFRRSCPASDTFIWVPEATSRDLAGQAASAVRARLPAPAGGFAPPTSAGVAHVGMWFWTDPATWRVVSVTAWVPTAGGVLSATATARPVRLTLSPGDEALGGRAASCSGPGPVWRPELGDDTVSPCQHTYEHSSAMVAGSRFPARLGIEWRISWRGSDGQGGPLPSFTTTSDYDVEVQEIQALVTG